MSEMPAPIPTDRFPDDVAQVVLTGAMFEWFQHAVRSRRLYLFPIPIGDEDLPTYGIAPVLPAATTEETP